MVVLSSEGDLGVSQIKIQEETKVKVQEIEGKRDIEVARIRYIDPLIVIQCGYSVLVLIYCILCFILVIFGKAPWWIGLVFPGLFIIPGGICIFLLFQRIEKRLSDFIGGKQ